MEGFAKALDVHGLGFPMCMMGREVARSNQNKLKFKTMLLKLFGKVYSPLKLDK